MIIIDPGHGGHDPGAIGPGGLKEKDVVLSVGHLLIGMLRAYDIDCRMTRECDEFLSLPKRATLANIHEAALTVSIHCNAGGGHGFELFTSPGQTDSDIAGIHILHSYAEAFPAKRGRYDMRDGDPDKEARFTVLTRTRGPAVLMELEFIDNPNGEAFLAAHGNHQSMAAALTTGITAFYRPFGASAKPIQTAEPLPHNPYLP